MSNFDNKASEVYFTFFLLLILTVLLFIPCVIWTGYCSQHIWNMWAPVFYPDAIKMTTVQAVGIHLVLDTFITIRTMRKSNKKDMEYPGEPLKSYFHAQANAFLRPAFFWFGSWVIYVFLV